MRVIDKTVGNEIEGHITKILHAVYGENDETGATELHAIIAKALVSRSREFSEYVWAEYGIDDGGELHGIRAWIARRPIDDRFLPVRDPESVRIRSTTSA